MSHLSDGVSSFMGRSMSNSSLEKSLKSSFTNFQFIHGSRCHVTCVEVKGQLARVASPSTISVLGIKVRPPGLLVSLFTLCSLSLALPLLFFKTVLYIQAYYIAGTFFFFLIKVCVREMCVSTGLSVPQAHDRHVYLGVRGHISVVFYLYHCFQESNSGYHACKRDAFTC